MKRVHCTSSWVAQEGKASGVALLRRIRDGRAAASFHVGRPGVPRDAKDRPEASREPCLSTLGRMLEPC